MFRPQIGLVVTMLAMAGCVNNGSHFDRTTCLEQECIQRASLYGLSARNHAAAEALIRNQLQNQPILDKSDTIMVSTFVNLDRLEESSSLGRLISEHIATRLTQLGYPVVATRLRSQVGYVQDHGELMLSREVAKVAAVHSVQAVVTGTFTIADDRIYVNANMNIPGSRLVVSSYDYELPLPNYSDTTESISISKMSRTGTWKVVDK
ncbi:MAG: hypothetical protein HQM00_02625 [Magnetococcales bacterium]|nr:hypothetical protein [Magnetococcales bacterium]